ncbi:MAG: hypothetical protein JW723_14770 [Bacteroidales bacterium]|nr:hypothetical protein [Bacteroidales bacterium]
MKLIDDTKVYIGRMVLKKKLKNLNRNTKVCNINEAKTVGIIYNATNSVSFEIIRDFARILMQKKIDVSVLGYVHSKRLIDHYLYRKGFDFFTKNNLNWYNRPKSDTVDDFIKKQYDILINLSLEKYYPIQYILALSPSQFKVGKYFEEPNYMDLMIDIEKEKKAMMAVKEEISKDKKVDKQKKEIEKEVGEKVDLELQISFLINQIMHYLAIIKSN